MKHTHIFRKLVAIFLVIAAMLPVFACTPSQQGKATPQPSAAIEMPEPDLTPYKGDGSKYVSIYTDERDKKCEADIVQLADNFLNIYRGHPKLTDVDTNVQLYTSPIIPEDTYENFYDPDLRTKFLNKINEILISVPELTEFEIIAGLSEAIAMIKDSHSYMKLPKDKMFPLEYFMIFNENGVELYAERVEVSYKDCLTARLDAINGVSINEILERVRPIITYEVESSFYSMAVDEIMSWYILNYIGVVGDTDSAVFTFTDASGKSFEKEIQAVDYDSGANVEMTRYLYKFNDTYGEDSLLNMYLTDNFEYKYFRDETVLYTRIWACRVGTNDPYGGCIDAINEIFNKIHDENKKIEKVIIDLRQNPGGRAEFAPALIRHLKELGDSVKKYIIIDEDVYSAGIETAACVKRAIPDVVLVGPPVSLYLSEIFSAYPSGGILPYLDVGYGYGVSPCYKCWPGYEGDALKPDKVIYQTYEDYLNGVDSILKELLSE